MTPRKALIVEDRPEVTLVLKPVLQALSFEIDSTRTISSASRKLHERAYDVVILDRLLPDGDGLDLLQHIEDATNHPRTLVLSVRSSTDQRILGLRKGADDYLAKPFSLDEFAARIQSLMKRTKQVAPKMLHIAKGMDYDTEHEILHFGTKQRQFTHTEARLFLLFLHYPYHRLTRENIATRLWSTEQYPTSTAVDVVVKRLRDKLRGMSFTIRTLRGVGYVMKRVASKRT